MSAACTTVVYVVHQTLPPPSEGVWLHQTTLLLILSTSKIETCEQGTNTGEPKINKPLPYNPT